MKYLGLPLISMQLKDRDCDILLSRFCARMEVWTCRFLSLAGRLQRSNARKGVYQVSWSTCQKKSEGGLGIRDLFKWNEACIVYQLWRILQPNPMSLWLIWVHTNFIHGKAFWVCKILCSYKNFLLCWWSSKFVVYWDGMSNNQVMTSIIYNSISACSTPPLWLDAIWHFSHSQILVTALVSL